MREVVARLTATTDVVNGIIGTVTAVEEAGKTLQTSVDQLAAKAVGVDANLTTMAARVSDVCIGTKELSDKVLQHEAALTSIRESLSRLAEAVQKLESGQNLEEGVGESTPQHAISVKDDQPIPPAAPMKKRAPRRGKQATPPEARAIEDCESSSAVPQDAVANIAPMTAHQILATGTM